MSRMSTPSGALGSLTANYTDSEDEDGFNDNSKDDSNTPKRPPNSDHNGELSQDGSNLKSDVSLQNSPIVNGRNSLSAIVSDTAVRTQRLVSYFDDTMVSDDEGTSVKSPAKILDAANGNKNNQDTLECQKDYASDGEADANGVAIPPEPSGPCPPDLQDKISNLYKRMKSQQKDMNAHIQKRKDFRNPSIYEKLIQFCNINELGTNFASDIFDPFKWSKESYYDELAKAQKQEMEKLEKARSDKSKKEKAKVEIVSGTAKKPVTAAVPVEEDVKKRKSKWEGTTAGTVVTETAFGPKKRL